MKIINTIFLIWLLIFNSINAGEEETYDVKNIIFYIGDGMGISQITAARIFLLGANERFNLEQMPVTGLITTHSADRLITDSAAGATAMATGFKTRNGMVGVSPDSMVLKTILEAAQERGMATGLIATSTITHATPACFVSHVLSRGNHSEIARQFNNSGVEVILGGGRQHFIPQEKSGSQRSDNLNLLDEATNLGYDVVSQKSQLEETKSGKILGLFAMDEMKQDPMQPTISNMTQKALEILSQDPDGFFLMVEGSQIDWAGHDNDFPALVREMAAFDTAVTLGLEFAENNGNTLVIVTADHETGGLLITGGDVSGKDIEIAWHYTSHTGQMVPIFAAGPGSHLFSGIHDNTEIPKILAELLNIKDFPAKLSSSFAQPDNKRNHHRSD
ncbi:MAG: alkaline phosphatase [Calditrichia bacterium]|nr:alkaline phosphatase [Calditrichia bacterium]